MRCDRGDADIENRDASAPQPAQHLARSTQVHVVALDDFGGDCERAGLEFVQPVHQREAGVLGSVCARHTAFNSVKAVGVDALQRGAWQLVPREEPHESVKNGRWVTVSVGYLVTERRKQRGLACTWLPFAAAINDLTVWDAPAVPAPARFEPPLPHRCP